MTGSPSAARARPETNPMTDQVLWRPTRSRLTDSLLTALAPSSPAPSPSAA
ncbi:hypothetical protein [Streptomyces sp. NPDC002324]